MHYYMCNEAQQQMPHAVLAHIYWLVKLMPYRKNKSSQVYKIVKIWKQDGFMNLVSKCIFLRRGLSPATWVRSTRPDTLSMTWRRCRCPTTDSISGLPYCGSRESLEISHECLYGSHITLIVTKNSPMTT